MGAQKGLAERPFHEPFFTWLGKKICAADPFRSDLS
jgi:hypothetical protein